MKPIHAISLTPDFGGVSGATPMTEPFERFSVTRKAVETAGNSLGVRSTRLKPGASKSAAFLRTGAV